MSYSEIIVMGYLICSTLCFLIAKFQFKNKLCFWWGIVPLVQLLVIAASFLYFLVDGIVPFVGQKLESFNEWIEK